MIVILEGPDNSGKTTLAGQLQQYIEASRNQHVSIVHHGVPDPEVPPLAGYVGALKLAKAHENRGIHTIFDRLALSEMIYGPLMRGGHRLGPGGYSKFQTIMQEVGAIEVVCLPSWDTVCDAFITNLAAGWEEYLSDKEMLFDVWESYRARVFNERAPGIRPYHYDWQQEGAFNALWTHLLGAR